MSRDVEPTTIKKKVEFDNIKTKEKKRVEDRSEEVIYGE